MSEERDTREKGFKPLGSYCRSNVKGYLSMMKCFRFLVVVILVFYVVSPAIAVSPYGLPPGYPQAKEPKVVYVPVPQKASTIGPTPPPKPTPPPSGTLTIMVSPSTARVTIDGSYTTEKTHNLRPGIHTIQVTAPGYLSKNEQIRVDSGDSSHISITLDKDPNYVAPVDLASLKVTSHPAGASVYIADRLNGTTPCTITAPVGPHTVTLRLEGYLDRAETVELCKTSGRSTQEVFWILTEETPPPRPVRTEPVIHETPSPSPAATLTRASAQSDEPADVLQYVVYFFRGLFGGNQ
jgi:hypothetical protein